MKKFMIIIICLLPLIVVASVVISSNIISSVTYIPVQNVTIIDKFTKEEVSQEYIILSDFVDENNSLIRTRDLSCRVYPTMSRNHKIKWSSSDESIASINDGKISFNGGFGGVTIFAESEDNGAAKSSVRLFVSDRRIRNIELFLNESNSLKEYEAMRVTYTILPASAIASNYIQWSCADLVGTDVVSIDANGIVYAKSAGTARITAMIDGVESSGAKYKVSTTMDIEVLPTEKLFTKDVIYVEGNSINLDNYLLKPTATMEVTEGGATLSDKMLTSLTRGETVVSAVNEGKSDSIRVIFSEGYVLGFKDIDLLYGNDFVSVPVWEKSNYLCLIPEILTEDSSIDKSKLKLVSDNEEVLVIVDNRVKAISKGSTKVRLFLEGEENKGVELTIDVVTPISDFTLNYEAYDDTALYVGKRVFGNYTMDVSGKITNSIPLMITSVDGVAFKETALSVEEAFNFTSSDENIATVDVYGNVYFNENYPFGEVSTPVTIQVKPKYSISSVVMVQKYEFRVVNGINLGIDFEVKDYEGGDYDDFRSYEQFASIVDKVWYMSVGAPRSFTFSEQNDEVLAQSLVQSTGAVVLHSDVYVPVEHNTDKRIKHTVFGNGNKIDAQIFRKPRETAWEYTFVIVDDCFDDLVTKINLYDLEMDNCEPKDDVLNYNNGGLFLKVEMYYNADHISPDRLVTFDNCLMQYAYCLLYGHNGDMVFKRTIFRNACYTSMPLLNWELYPCNVTYENCIWSNISGPAVSVYSSTDTPCEKCRFGELRFVGQNYCYNWKTVKDVRLDIIAPDYKLAEGLDAATLNKFINQTARKEFSARKEELLYYDEQNDEYCTNFGVFIIGLWNTTNKYYYNEPREDNIGSGFALYAERSELKIITFDMSKNSVSPIMTLINGYGWKGVNYIIDFADEEGNFVVGPHDNFDSLSTDEIRDMLLGK